METRKIKAVELHDGDLAGFVWNDTILKQDDLNGINKIYKELCNEADEEEIGDFYNKYGLEEGDYYPPFVTEAVEKYLDSKNRKIVEPLIKKTDDFLNELPLFFENIDIQFFTPFYYSIGDDEKIAITAIRNGKIYDDNNNSYEWHSLSWDWLFRLIKHVKVEYKNRVIFY